MKKLLAIVLVGSMISCGEEPQPPVRTKAPEAHSGGKIERKSTAEITPPPKEQPKAPPPPAPPPEDKPKPPPADVPKALLDPGAPDWRVTAPDKYKAKFSTSKGDFTIEVTREWAPQGADRFYALVKNGYFDNVRFFRVISNFMVQFGINGEPSVNSAWKNNVFPDDPVTQSNTRGMITFATRGKNSRTTQVFINFKDNTNLDGMGFSPFGKVVEGMEVVDSINPEYGEGAPRGRGPDQQKLQAEGNAYLNASFPKLDFVKTAKIVQ
jgi:peptidyl-prolyl cis-trans isomerase A (cyclophilin A)